MFDKIKGKLKGIFEKQEEIIEENFDEVVEVEEEKIEKIKVEEKPKKKGFLSKIFGSDDEEEDVEIEVVDKKQKKDVKEKLIVSNEKKVKLENKKVEKVKKEVIKQEVVEEKIEDIKGEKQEEEKDEGGFFSKTFKKLKSKSLTEDDFDKIWLELEIFLLEINIAYEIVERIEVKLREVLIGNSFDRFKLSEAIREVMIDEVEKVLVAREADLLGRIRELNKNGEIAKILVLGVNGTGKTTSIAKIVRLFDKNGFSLVVAAADTFRAAAVEQLDEHAKRVGFKLIKHKGGSDPAAVAYDAIEHAKAKKLDVVLIDTAGRMPNNANLMQELNKVNRVSGAQIVLFVGDSVSGNDLIDQIELFDKIVPIDGLILTKTDTDERPGSVVTAAYSIEKPIYYLGVGQGYDDLVKFDSKVVAQKLFDLGE